MAELVYAHDSGSCPHYVGSGSSPVICNNRLLFVVDRLGSRRRESLLSKTADYKVGVPAKQESKTHEIKPPPKEAVSASARAL